MIAIPENWPDYVAGLHGVTLEARKAMNVLVRLNAERVEVFHAAMSGRVWMYYYECERGNVAPLEVELLLPGDYWRSVVEAVALAAKTPNPYEEVAWFLEPIPDTRQNWNSALAAHIGLGVEKM